MSFYMFEARFKHANRLYREAQMKRGKPIILLLTIVLAAIAVVFGRNEISMRNFPFSVIVTSDGVQEEIHCLKLAGEYYVFLPGYAEGNARICTNRIYDVTIAGQQLRENMSCEDFPVNTKLDLVFRSAENEGHETVTFVRSANVATMYIDVPSGNMDYIHEKKGNAEAAAVRLYTEDGRLNYTGSAESLKGRGNATWAEAEKKPYSLELLQEADLLSMGKARNWILLSNVWDTSNIRNKIAYDTAAAAGAAFSPNTSWVDLYLNGEYAGLYLLSERNEVHPERVQIPDETGFLVSLEFPYRLVEQGYPHVKTEKGLALRIHHTSMGQQELETLWQSVENAILAENGIDPVSGKHWQELIDLDSWAHKYLLEELFANYDAGSISQYFYCDTSQSPAKIYAGPIWDFDNAMGRGGWTTSNPRSFLANRAHFFSEEDAPLFHGLYQKDEFYHRVVELFVSVYEPLFAELLDHQLYAYAERVAQAKCSDHIRWQTGDPQDIEKIETYLKDRLEFYHDLWVNQSEYCQVELTVDCSTWGCYLVQKGEMLLELPEAGGSVWRYADTGEPFDIQKPILEDLRIYQKTE